MDGYIFVKYQDGIPYLKLQDMSYFSTVLCSHERGTIVYSIVDDSTLAPLRKGVEDLNVCQFIVGDKVCVIRGEFKNLTGTVRMIHEGGETVLVDVSQRSKLMLIDFPVIYLQKVQ